MKVPPVSTAVRVTLAGRPTFNAIVTRSHEYSGMIEIWAPPATRMPLYRSGEQWRDGDRRTARVEVLELETSDSNRRCSCLSDSL
jgi:hypothetical protein